MKNKRLLCVSVFMLLLNGCGNETTQTPKNEVVRVRIMNIEPERVSIPVYSTGILASAEEIRLSFKTGGIIAEINAREGVSVRKGDILATLNLAEINANAELARNGYEKALRDYTRAKNLYADTVVTLEQLQNTTTALNIAKSNLEIVKFNLLHSAIKAPSDGTVLRQLVRENELVGAGYPVFLFGAKGRYWRVVTALADREIVRINPGDSATVSVDAYPGITFHAVVEQISAISDPMTGTFQTELDLDDMGYRLASGFIAGVDIFPSESKSYFLVPVGSIIDAEGSSGFIFSISDSSTAVRYPVNIEAFRGSEVAVSGIPEDVRTIITEGAAYIRDGMKVETIK